MKYNHEWLLGVKAKLAAIMNIVPIYDIGDNDPDHIKDVKKRLHHLQIDAEGLFGILYNMVEEAYKDEYTLADAAGHAREKEENR